MLLRKCLGLREQGLRSISLIYVGYADKERNWLAPMKKVRVPTEEFVLEYS